MNDFSPKKIRADIKTIDNIFLVIFFILSIVAIDFGLFGLFNLGYSIAMSLLIICVFLYSGLKNKGSVLGLYLSICAIIFALSFAFYNSYLSKVILFFYIIFLLAIILLSNSGSSKFGFKKINCIIDIFSLIFVTPFLRIGDTFSLFKDQTNKNKKLIPILMGILCSLPALLIILPLLIRSDAAFEGLLKHTVFYNIPRFFGSLILGVILFIFSFTAIFSATNKKIYSEKIDKKTLTSVSLSKLPSVAVNSFLSVISFVYIVYLFSQMSYFFGAFKGLLPDNFTIAQYARRGFFEMSAICAINLIIIGFSLILSSKNKNGKTNKYTKGICFFLSFFSLAIISTVFAKLFLYIKDFGLTQLRIYTTVFSAILAIIFICIILKLFIDNFPYFAVSLIIITLMGIFVSSFDINTTIAKYNYDLYISKKSNEIDVYTLGSLNDAGVKYLINLLDDKNIKVSQEAAYELLAIAYEYGDNESLNDLYIYHGQYKDNFEYQYDEYDIEYNKSLLIKGDYKLKDDDYRSFNVGRSKSKKLIFENFEKIKTIYNNSVISKS